MGGKRTAKGVIYQNGDRRLEVEALIPGGSMSELTSIENSPAPDTGGLARDLAMEVMRKLIAKYRRII